MQDSIQDITGVTVCSNTKDLIERAYNSVRACHPDMKLLIIDGSNRNDPCYSYAVSLASHLTTVGVYGYNIGHGRGMDAAIRLVKTKYALIFDSDIVMHQSPVQEMLDLMEEDTYGIGYLEKTGLDGFEYGAKSHHKNEEFMFMLHPYFQLLNVANYFKFHPYVHHGAPCFKAALDIHKRGLTSKIIKEFPGLGHSSGKGWVWTGQSRKYIQHDPAGTRSRRREKGLPEIEGQWER